VGKDTLMRLLRLLGSVAEQTFHTDRSREPEDFVDARRAELAPIVPHLIALLPALPLEGFRAGCEQAIQSIANLLRSRHVKAQVVERYILAPGAPKGAADSSSPNLLSALHARLVSGGMLDCNICIKVARLVATILWADGDSPPAPLVSAISRSSLGGDLLAAAVQHSEHSFTQSRVLDVIHKLLQAEAACARASSSRAGAGPRIPGLAANAAKCAGFMRVVRAKASTSMRPPASAGSGGRGRQSDEQSARSSAAAILAALSS
jgi:hypothetical protein